MLKLLRTWTILLLLATISPSHAQQVAFAGLQARSGQGAFNAVQTDATGNLYVAFDHGDGIRVQKFSADALSLLAQIHLGAAGDHALSLAIDPAGNLYVTGTTTSTTLSGTAGAAYPNRADTSLNSFAASLSPSLSLRWLSFLGAGKTAAAAIATNGTTTVVTGSTYSTSFPVTSAGVQQTPAPSSNGNGFIEAFNTNDGSVVYATYLTGANGDTNPAAIAEDSSGNAYVAGTVTASGFPTVNALIQRILFRSGSNVSGFLGKLSAAGDRFLFSTFVPGGGLSSVALDGNSVLVSGDIEGGLFPVARAQAPLAAGLTYQSVLRIANDGQSVTDGSVIASATSSVIASAGSGALWIAGTLQGRLLPLPSVEGIGEGFAARLNAQGAVDRVTRIGGVPIGNIGFASLPLSAIAITTDTNGNPTLAATLTPTVSGSLVPTQRFDLPLLPTPALAATVRDAVPPSNCGGSSCMGGAGELVHLLPSSTSPSLALSLDGLPNLTLRNLGTATASGLTFTASGYTLATSCGNTLAAGAECDLALTGNGPGTITATSSNAPTAYASLPTNSLTPDAISVTPKELDFGIQTSHSVAAAGTASATSARTLTVTNLTTTAQTFPDRLDQTSNYGWSFTEAASDCTAAGLGMKLLAAGATCHITLGLHASPQTTDNGLVESHWLIGTRDVLLTGYTQAASLSASTTQIDFGRNYIHNIKSPRYLFLSNASDTPQGHAAISLPAGSNFTAIDGCGKTLQPNSICRIEFDYAAPSAPSDDAITLTLDTGSQLLVHGETVPLPGAAGAAANPNLSASPSSVAFLNSVPATTISSETQTVTLANTGVSSFPLSLSLAGDFTDTTDCAATLAAGATCRIVLNFTPSDVGLRQGLLSITAGGGGPLYLPISGDATAVFPSNSETLAYGDVPIGVPSVQWLKLKASFSSVTVSATGGDFTAILVEDIGFGHGTPPPSHFAQTASSSCLNCWLGLQFKPASNGIQSGSVSFSSSTNGKPAIITVTGNGIAQTGLLLTPTSQDFGVVLVGSSSASTLFTLTNATANALSLSSPVFTGDFSLSTVTTGSPACSGSLAASASCIVPVLFAPSAVGFRTGSITVATASASLSGYGSPSSGVAFNPAALLFNNVPGTQATQQTVVISNNSSGPLSIGAVATSNPSFATTSQCSTLAPGATCTITVSFTPATSRVVDNLIVPVTSTPAGAALLTTYTLPLNGEDTTEDAGLQITPQQMNFGSASTSAAGAIRSFTVNNLTLKAMTVTLDTPRNFALLSNTCGGLAPNASCQVSAQFVPLLNGTLTGTLFFTGTPTDNSASVNALGYFEGYGQGVGSLQITGNLSPSGILDFGQVTSGQTKTQTITLTNPASAATSVTAASAGTSVTAASAATSVTVRRVTSGWPFLSTTTCGAVLAPSQTCTVHLTYSPLFQVAAAGSSARTDDGVLVIESDASTGPQTIDLTGSAAPQTVATPDNTAPLVSLVTSQGSLTFNAATAGATASTQIVTVTNTGTVTLHIAATSTASADFQATSNCGALLAGASCAVTVAFTPQAAGLRLDALSILSDASTALEFVSLSGTGVSASVAISPSTLSFGSVLLGGSSTLNTTVQNNGASAVFFGTISATGDYATGGTCPANGSTLAAGATCQVAVTFTPLTSGARRGTLTVPTSATTLPLQVTLNGSGVSPLLVVTPATLNFGSVAIGQSARLSFTLANPTATPVTSVVVTQTGTGYSLSSTCGPAGLAPGSSCSITVAFAPTTVGQSTGTVSIASSDPTSPVLVSLTGTAVENGSFSMTVNGASTASATVVQGLPSSFNLALAPTFGFSGSIALTCTPTSTTSYTFCSVSPSTVTLGTGTVNSTVTITTVSASASMQWLQSPFAKTLTIALCGLLPLGAAFFRRKRLLSLGLLLLLIAPTLALSGCGKTNTVVVSSTDSRIRYADPGSYTFTVTGAATSGIPVSQSVNLTVTITAK